MTNPQNAFFFESKILFVFLKYYLFFYGQKPIDINLIELHLQIIEELDRKQHKIRSLRGFFFML